MSVDYNKEVGKLIKSYRKLKKMTLSDLADKIYKSKSTISKYENGQIQIDIDSLYAIATALDISVEKLLYIEDDSILEDQKRDLPKFFRELTSFYAYIFDGRNNEVIKSKLKIRSKISDDNYTIIMYMNYKDEENYQVCENTYLGHIEHFDAKTNIVLTNRDTPMEKAMIQILASFLESETKWGLWSGFSTRPMMPIASKILISKNQLNINNELINKLKISKEDIRYLKLYNMFSVI